MMSHGVYLGFRIRNNSKPVPPLGLSRVRMIFALRLGVSQGNGFIKIGDPLVRETDYD